MWEEEKCLAERHLRDLHNNDCPNVITQFVDQTSVGIKAESLRTDPTSNYLKNKSRIPIFLILFAFFSGDEVLKKKII